MMPRGQERIRKCPLDREISMENSRCMGTMAKFGDTRAWLLCITFPSLSCLCCLSVHERGQSRPLSSSSGFSFAWGDVFKTQFAKSLLEV